MGPGCKEGLFRLISLSFEGQVHSWESNREQKQSFEKKWSHHRKGNGFCMESNTVHSVWFPAHVWWWSIAIFGKLLYWCIYHRSSGYLALLWNVYENMFMGKRSLTLLIKSHLLNRWRTLRPALSMKRAPLKLVKTSSSTFSRGESTTRKQWQRWFLGFARMSSMNFLMNLAQR